MSKNNKKGERVARPIVRISIFTITLATVVNLLSIAIVTGYQEQVKNKVMGFISPIFISKIDPEQLGVDPTLKRTSIFESEPIPMDSLLIQEVSKVENVSSMHAVIYRPALLYSKKILENTKGSDGKDSIIETYENKDVLCKGITSNYSWDFIDQHLVEGTTDDLTENQLIVSSKIANMLNYRIGDTVNIGFITNGSFPLKEFEIKAIYNTGFSDYDDKIAFCPMSTLQEYCGLKSTNYFDVSFSNNYDSLYLQLFSNRGVDNSRIYLDGKSVSNSIGIMDTGTYPLEIETLNEFGTVDYFYYELQVQSDDEQAFQKFSFENALIQGNRTKHISIQTQKNNKISIDISEKEMDREAFISGYELVLHNNNKIEETKIEIENLIGLNTTSSTPYIQVSSVFEAERDLFVWLDLLDLNVYVIIVLMLVVGIVNAGSAILVVISVKRNFIGMMKAMGANNLLIRKVFLAHAGTIILKGLVLGNIIGLLALGIQYKWAVIPLNPEIYYLDHVPIHFSWKLFIFMNILSFSVCLISLVLPTYLISKINPIKSIKFN